MIKELIIAIALGIVAGFGITSGIVKIKQNPKTSPTQKQTQITPTETIPTPSLSVSSTNSNFLELTTPENETIVSTDKIKLSGKTNPNSNIIINTPLDTIYIKANEFGEFESNISIDTGANLINISSFDENDTQTDEQIMITYSTSKI